MVSSTASSLIVLFIIFTSFKFASLTRYAPSVRDILVMQVRYYSATQNSDIFATRNIFRVANVVESTLFINPHAAQFAAYRLP